MFTGNMVTEAIPARVYALYKIACSKKEITKTEVQSLMEPKGIYEGSSYFSPILKAATELKLVDIENNIVVPSVPKEQIKDMDAFRLYVISKLNSFSGEQFFLCTNALVNANEKVFELGKISDTAMLNYLSDSSGQQISAPMARGLRFWLQFLGFGYMQDFYFLPNAYVFTKNVLKLMDLNKNEEYKTKDFINSFNSYGEILTLNMQPEKNINLAFSSALRELHDNKEIELKYGSDAENRWTLFPSAVAFNNQIDSIVYKGVRK